MLALRSGHGARALGPRLGRPLEPAGARGIAKYARKGVWARGEDGEYTMDDLRIFTPGMRRKYPYHKVRVPSKPYMCARHSAPSPPGSAVKLAISYIPWSGADTFYRLKAALLDRLPGAQIIGNANPNLREMTMDPESPIPALRAGMALRVMRLNDRRVLLGLQGEGRAAEALAAPALDRLAAEAADNFDWRYGPPE